MTKLDENSSFSSEFTEEDELFEYINKLEIENIKIFLNKNELPIPIWDYKCKENQNSSVLNISAYRKSFEISKLLIDYCKEKKPDKLKEFINASNDQGIAPLHYASFRGEVKIIDLLLENGAKLTIKTQRQLNVIHYCAQGNRPNALMYFYLKLRDNSDIRNKYKLIKEKDGGGSSPLHWAVYSLAEDFLLYLINLDIFDSEKEKIEFINDLDNQGYSPLHLSVSSKSSRLTVKLLQNGANPLKEDQKGKTPLQLAIEKNQDDIIQILSNVQSCQLCNFKAPVKQLKKSSKNVICIFVFQFIAIIILFGSVLPIFYNFYENMFGKISIYCSISLLSVFFIIYLLLLIINPGLKEKNNLDDLRGLIKEDIDLTKYCYKCFIEKTKTSKHCIICDSCYDRFDHHCYWINKCVAKNNYILFLMFLFETALYLLTILVITVLSLTEFIKNKFEVKRITICNIIYCGKYDDIYDKLFDNNNVKKIIHLILNIALILIILLFLIPEMLLLILHIYVCCSNYREENKNKKTLSNNASLLNEDDTSLLVSNE